VVVVFSKPLGLLEFWSSRCFVPVVVLLFCFFLGQAEDFRFWLVEKGGCWRFSSGDVDSKLDLVNSADFPFTRTLLLRLSAFSGHDGCLMSSCGTFLFGT
jgi:hypothetical protein